MPEHDANVLATTTPERLGPYTLLEPLGEGGMARVYLAKKDGAGAVCVLKRLHVQLEGHPIALKRFQREAHIASLLEHPSIARIVDVGMEAERVYLAMEYIAGQTLEALIFQSAAKWGALPLGVALAIALEVLDGLAFAHEAQEPDSGSRLGKAEPPVDASRSRPAGRPLNIVHRDLTPRNVMLSYAGRVAIIDFGIARGDVDDFKTAPGVLMGTPYYMSPEQAKTAPVDAKSDVYTFGAVLFEMLTGQRLVKVKGRAQILLAVVNEPAPPASSVSPRVPPVFDAVLARALAKKPEDRFPSARDFRDALAKAAAGQPRANRADLAQIMRELFPSGEEEAKRRIAFGQKPLSPTEMEASLPPTLITTPAPAPPASVSLGGANFSDPSLNAMRLAHERSRRSMLFFGLGAAILLAGLMAVLFTSVPAPAPILVERADPAPREIPRASALPRTEPKPEPKPEREVAPEPDKPELARPAKKREAPPPLAHAAHEPELPKPAQPAARFAELHEMLAKLAKSPDDANLRTRLHDRIEAAAEPLPPKRRARIQAAIDEAIRSVELDGLERGLKQLELAAAAGELP